MSFSEESAVLDVIQAENRAFWMRDGVTFRRFHLPSEETLRWGYWQGGGFVLRRGWSEIERRSLQHMESLQEPVPEFADAPLSNLTLRVGTDVAWASYDRHYPYLPRLRGRGPNGITQNLRVLEKHGGSWLIAVSGVLDPHLGAEFVLRVRQDGTVLWKSAPAVERLRSDEHFFLASQRLRLRDRKLNVRLQRALEWAAGFDSKFMPQRAAVPLYLPSDAGSPRVSWIVPDFDAALVFIDDNRSVIERVSVAAQAFALSPLQTRLASAICEGREVKEFAADQAISVNTARTHLKRIFEKVGVTSQASLARALISFSPPR